MTFNIFTTKRVSCFGQYDRIDDLITCKLRGDKRPVHGQFLIDEFHFSAVFECFDPHFVWHLRTSTAGISAFKQVSPVFQERSLPAACIAGAMRRLPCPPQKGKQKPLQLVLLPLTPSDSRSG